jgi:hypothetical protein
MVDLCFFVLYLVFENMFLSWNSPRHRRNLGEGANIAPIFFYLRIMFWATELKRGKRKLG